MKSDRLLLLSGRFQTLATRNTSSEFDPQRTWRGRLLDHLIGAGEDGGRHREAERLRGLEVDNEFELGRLHDRQVSRLGALEDPSGVNAGLAQDSRKARCIADQAAGSGVFPDVIHCGNSMARRQRRELLAMTGEKGVGGGDERTGM